MNYQTLHHKTSNLTKFILLLRKGLFSFAISVSTTECNSNKP